VFSKNKAQHAKHLQLIINRLQKHKFYVKLIKYKFFITEMKFLKFIVNMNEMSINFNQINIIVNWSEFKIFQKIQIFLNFINFYWWFICNYFHVVESLINLLKKSKMSKKIRFFTFTEKIWKAFMKLKKIFETASLLMHFNFWKKMQIKADASEIVTEAILSQWISDEKLLKIKIEMTSDQREEAWHSIVFFSKKLESAELNYDIHDLQLLAIVWVFKHWRHYLKNNSHSIQMLTDHVNLQYFFMMKKLNQKQTHWAEKLAMFNFYIEYQTNKRNLTDRSSRQLNYESVDSSHTELLLTFQNKLTQDWMNSASDQ